MRPIGLSGAPDISYLATYRFGCGASFRHQQADAEEGDTFHPEDLKLPA
jgi:hypothetical protein